MEPFLCEIKLFAGNYAPRGWAFCNGQILPISQYQAVFTILGYTYGGDGKTTFALPDLRGRVPIHTGASTGPRAREVRLGESSGSNDNTLTIGNLPKHNHPVFANNQQGTSGNPTDNFPANSGASDKEYTDNSNTSMNHHMTGLVGGDLPVNNMQPYLGLNFIIALYGEFPSHD